MQMKNGVVVLLCLICVGVGFLISNWMNRNGFGAVQEPSAPAAMLHIERAETKTEAAPTIPPVQDQATAQPQVSGDAPPPNMHYPPCSSVIHGAMLAATKNAFTSASDCVGEEMDDMVLLRGRNAEKVAVMTGDILLPVREWIPDAVSAFMIPGQSHIGVAQTDPAKEALLDPNQMLCAPRKIELQIASSDAETLDEAGLAQALSAGMERLMIGFGPSFTKKEIADAPASPMDQDAIKAEFLDFQKKFGDFALGGLYDSKDHLLNVFILSPKNLNACPDMMRHGLVEKIVTGFPGILKQRPQKMTLSCDQVLKQPFTLNQTGQYGDPCTTPIVVLSVIGTKPLHYRIQDIAPPSEQPGMTRP